MKILISVNTPFQMIVAIQLTVTEFCNDTVDLIISDNIAQYTSIAERITQSGIFKNVSMIEAKGFNWKSYKFTSAGIFYNHELYKRNTWLKNNVYDLYLFANVGGVSECIATLLNKKYNTELAMFEDGFLAYSDFCKREIADSIHPESLRGKVVYHFRRRAPAYISKYYVFSDSLLVDWNFNFEIKKINQINDETVSILNYAFDYQNLKDDYDYKYIFFEESYYADGIDVNDLNIVKTIANMVGKEKLLVKIHPRNPTNRFKECGIATNTDTSVPWEVIALNMDLSEKTLITIASGSSITSYFISGRKAEKSVLLYEMDNMDRAKLTPSLTVFDKICKKDDYFVYPHSMEELNKILIDRK